MGDGARGLALGRLAPAEGIKKAGGPIWPTARSFVLAALPPRAGCQVGADFPRTTAYPPVRAVAFVAFATLRMYTPRGVAAVLANLRESKRGLGILSTVQLACLAGRHPVASQTG